MREPAPTQTEIAYAQARQLLDRDGILTREIARGEGIAGGFAGMYPMLRLPLEISRVDGIAVRETPWAARLESAGFTPSYRGLTFRP
ncbi:MAG: hypothetical protein OXB92_14535 [Acidimicrobiaceae bacterium]|nr:hypothetical protein [Acidimicrobiia bacterium]MCY4495063.1 hypothetical protein [Acidimicrobiaceae bacterium]